MFPPNLAHCQLNSLYGVKFGSSAEIDASANFSAYLAVRARVVTCRVPFPAIKAMVLHPIRYRNQNRLSISHRRSIASISTDPKGIIDCNPYFIAIAPYRRSQSVDVLGFVYARLCFLVSCELRLRLFHPTQGTWGPILIHFRYEIAIASQPVCAGGRFCNAFPPPICDMKYR